MVAKAGLDLHQSTSEGTLAEKREALERNAHVAQMELDQISAKKMATRDAAAALFAKRKKQEMDNRTTAEDGL